MDKLPEDTNIYRILSFKHFKDLCEKKETYFRKVIKWEDTWEIPTKDIPTVDKNGKEIHGMNVFSDVLYGQCWSLHEETDAMWRIYSPDKIGIKIKTSIKKLQNIDAPGGRLHFGVVEYFESKDLISKIRSKGIMFRSALLKRKEFEHESEVRLLYYDDVTWGEHEGNLLKIKDLDSFIEEICIDPRADESTVGLFKEFCKSKGLITKVTESDMYKKINWKDIGLYMQL